MWVGGQAGGRVSFGENTTKYNALACMDGSVGRRFRTSVPYEVPYKVLYILYMCTLGCCDGLISPPRTDKSLVFFQYMR